MKYILQTDNETIEIPIIRSKRKTLGLEVKYDGTVNARVPMRAPREIIERFIREHEAWIIRKRQEWSLAGNNQDDVAGEFGERKKRGANAVDPSKILPPVETKEGKAKIRQYIERQVVLFDSIEDAAFQQLHSESDSGTVLNLYERASQEDHLNAIRQKMDDFAIKIVF